MTDSNNAPFSVLVIDDEQDIVDLIAFNLEKAGFKPLTAIDGNTGITVAQREIPDLIVLDIMLPGCSGLQVFESLKADTRTKDIPVIMLSAKAETTDRITGLKMGADDYITKPFSPKELLLRIQSILRWVREPTEGLVVRSGPFFLEKPQLRCYVDGELINLTVTEFKLLCYLMERPGQVASREELLANVWGYGEAPSKSSRTLETHLMRLREKIGPQAAAHLRNVRNEGYRFDETFEK